MAFEAMKLIYAVLVVTLRNGPKMAVFLNFYNSYSLSHGGSSGH